MVAHPHPPHVWTYYVGCVIAILAGFVLLVSILWKELTWKDIIVKFISSGSISYLAYFVYKYYQVKMGLEIWLFLSSFFSSMIASLLLNAGKVGVMSYFRMILQRILSDTEPHKRRR